MIFSPGGKAEMVEYGIGLNHYAGTYRLEKDGKMTAEFKEFGQDWPVMVLGRDERSLTLRRADGRKGFIIGNRGGATIPRGVGSYWPFRSVEKSERSG